MSFVPRLFLPSLPPAGVEVSLPGPISRYLVKVLRLGAGDRFYGFDGKGMEWEFIIKESNVQAATASRAEKKSKSVMTSSLQLALAQGLPKGSKMDLILRQGTEAGTHRFIPLLTQRSVSRPEDSKYQHKNARWQKILVEACRQCGRADVPQLDLVTPWKDMLKHFDEFDLVLMPYEREAPDLRTVLELKPTAGKILVLIGPEGGWAENEIRQAHEAGAQPVHLPTPILRTETAGLVAVSMVQFFLCSI